MQIDQYMDAAELSAETAYYLILIYIPNAEGGLNTVYSRNPMSGEEMDRAYTFAQRACLPFRFAGTEIYGQAYCCGYQQ